MESLVWWMLILWLSKPWHHAGKMFARAGTSQEHSLLVVQRWNAAHESAGTTGQMCLASTVLGGKENERDCHNCPLLNAASVCACISCRCQSPSHYVPLWHHGSRIQPAVSEWSLLSPSKPGTALCALFQKNVFHTVLRIEVSLYCI